MLAFNHKYLFTDAAKLSSVIEQTLGATVYANGNFEAASDEPLPGWSLPISEPVVVRVTARTDKERAFWSWKILDAAGDGAQLDTSERGYWGPTDEYEPSWKITTTLTDPASLAEVIYQWLTACQQQSVYLEYGGHVLILDAEEVPAYFGIPA